MDGRSAATTALRAASTACVIGGDLVTSPLGWIPTCAGHLLEGAAALVDSGPGWKAPHRTAMSRALNDALAVVPEVKDTEAASIAEGVVSFVSVVRRWVA